MSASRTRVVVAAGVLLAMVGGLAGSAPASRRSPDRRPHQRQANEMYGCDRTFGRQPEGHLVKRTNPAGGQRVKAGGSIVVTITWAAADWSGDQLHKVLDCVAIDGELVPSLQDGESPTANDGRFTTVYRVPADAPDGAQICDQAMLSGPSPRDDYDRQISNQVCHTVESGANGCGQGCGQRAPCDRGCARPAPPPCRDGCAERPSPQPCRDGCA